MAPVQAVITSDSGGCICQACGRRYRVDWIIPSRLWEEIKPAGKAEGAGMLCGRCISDRIEARGQYAVLICVEDRDRSLE